MKLAEYAQKTIWIHTKVMSGLAHEYDPKLL